MKILVLAEINDGELAEDQTSKTVSAAATLGKVDVLCASNNLSLIHISEPTRPY